MTGIYAKRAVLILVLLIVVVEGYFAYRWYAQYHGLGGTASDTASGGAALLEGTMPGGTSPSDADETTFAHTATDGNSRGDYTYLSDPSLDGDPNALVLAAPSQERGSTEGGSYDHNIGVSFEPEAQRWAIFNQDRTVVPTDVAFEVVIPRESSAFVHRSGTANTVGNSTYLDNPLPNGQPDVLSSVTQNWNPRGVGGVYNDHPVSVLYDEDVNRWAIYNEDGSPMPERSAFNVAVSDGLITHRIVTLHPYLGESHTVVASEVDRLEPLRESADATRDVVELCLRANQLNCDSVFVHVNHTQTNVPLGSLRSLCLGLELFASEYGGRARL